MNEDPRQVLHRRLQAQGERRRRAEQGRETLFSQTVYLSTIGLLLVLPPVAGGYLGNWLDGMAEGYSARWTISLLFLGIVVGAVNVYLFIRERS